MYLVKDRRLMEDDDEWVDEKGNFVEIDVTSVTEGGSEHLGTMDRSRYLLALTRLRAGLPPDHH